jgi:hypothetical protein
VCGSYHNFLDRERVAPNKETNEPRVLSGYVEVITMKVHCHHHDNRRTDNTIVKRKNTNKQWFTKHYTEHYK